MYYLLAIGSNIQPARHIPWLLSRISKISSVITVSRFFRSQPHQMRSRRIFWNGALLLDCDLSVTTLKQQLCYWEELTGRNRSHPQCSSRDRTLDIDILWSEQGGWYEPLCELRQRAYLAVPLASLLGHRTVPKNRQLFRHTAWQTLSAERMVVVRFRFSGFLLGSRARRLR